MNRFLIACLLIVHSASSWGQDTPATDLRAALAVPQTEDSRTREHVTLNGHFPMKAPENPAQWYARAENLRQRVLVATGLWPMPERTPLNPWIGPIAKRDGFTVQRVSFESLPGHHVSGLLFRPSEDIEAPEAGRPGVLCPHGHGGRMQVYSDAEIAKKIAAGEEHFAASGSTPKLARCATLARMGCVCFMFDMLGYADSIQIPYEIAHRHANARPSEKAPDENGWVFFSPEADLRLQSIMSLQTWNAERALDFVASLPDVDPERLAVTGNSGGGTQTILLGAIDPRIKVGFPNGMVSTSMQGGCYCENCNYLRIDTGNVELAALFAPRPQAMSAADDWTRDMMTDGYPQLRWLYAMIGNESDVYCRPMLDHPHNFNYVTRATMYQWMNKHLKLGLDDPVVESDWVPLTEAESTVWGEDHPAPTNTGEPHEREVLRWFEKQAVANLALPKGEPAKKAFDETIGVAWRVMLDPTVSQDDSVKLESMTHNALGKYSVLTAVLNDTARDAKIPFAVFHAGTPDPQSMHAGTKVIWTDPAGIEVAVDAAGNLNPKIAELIESGAAVMTCDLALQSKNRGKTPENGARLIDDKRNYSAFTFGYNRTLTSERVRDLMTVIAWTAKRSGDKVRVIGTGYASTWAAAAVAFSHDAVAKVMLDTSEFRFADAGAYSDERFVPGAVKYGDLPALLAGCAPTPLRVFGESGVVPEMTSVLYSANNASDQIESRDGEIAESDLNWLAK
ncbi:acetylxylan esterase [Stieleria varia]|uniref:Acetyl xylan esterase (AXE1) n=1 Tax=Stieleria varia TaxID=2528005 RepID=A0A5C6A5Q0_9BACT|nr:acetylxylan esterase [Stieleria varia]TWT94628.1 Acetyl xylan esterase (AXE1) [Stieleria varia]